MSKEGATDQTSDATVVRRDTERLDWLNRNYGTKKLKLLKGGILACNEWQPDIRTAIDKLIQEQKVSA